MRLSVTAQDVGVTGIEDSHGGAAEELTASGTELNVVAIVVMDRSLGKHGIVLDLRLAERRAVTSKDDELGWKKEKRCGC